MFLCYKFMVVASPSFPPFWFCFVWMEGPIGELQALGVTTVRGRRNAGVSERV